MPTVTFVLPDTEALHRVQGSLAYLSSRRYTVNVGIEEDPPGAPSLGLFDSRYAGMSVARLPVIDLDSWRPFATIVRKSVTRLRARSGGGLVRSRLLSILAALERAIPPPAAVLDVLRKQKPDLVVVARLHGPCAPHVDYLRAAGILDIPTLFMTLGWDDLADSGLSHVTPDCVAVWNRVQRREAVERHGVPVRRTCVIGAHLATDVLDIREVPTREEYCAGIRVDPSRRIVLLACPGASGGDVRGRVRAWHAALREHPDPAVRESAVIVFTPSRGDAEAVLALDMPGLVVVQAGIDQFGTAKRLHEALLHADVVVTSDAEMMLEGLARQRPVLARADEGDVGPFGEHMHGAFGWPMVARSLDEHLRQMAGVLHGSIDRARLVEARAFVRVHGNHLEPGFLLGARIIRDVVENPSSRLAGQSPEEGWRGARWLAAAARWLERGRPGVAPARDGRRLFMLALPSAGALDEYQPLMAALVSRGHRVVVVFTPGPGRPNEAFRTLSSGIDGVTIAGVLPPRGGLWWRVAHVVSALGMFLTLVDITHSARNAPWRRRLGRVVLPGWMRGLQTMASWDGVSRGMHRLVALLDASLRPSRSAVRVIDRRRPDAVLVFPDLDVLAAVPNGAAQADLIRAARACDVAVAVSVAGTDTPINGSITQTPADAWLVWNEAQKRYLERRAASPPVIVGGAVPLDAYVDVNGIIDAQAFHQLLGLDVQRPYVLFVGSSGLLGDASAEVKFVHRWVAEMRRTPDSPLRDLPVLIRPSPLRASAWRKANFSGLGDVVLCPSEYDPGGELDGVLLAESVRYAAAVVSPSGLPLMLAAAGARPAIAVVVGDEKGGAKSRRAPLDGLWTLRQAPILLARSLPELNARLTSALSAAPNPDRTRHYVRHTLRPHGVTHAPSEALVEELERFLKTARQRERKRPADGGRRVAATGALASLAQWRQSRRSNGRPAQ